MPVRWSIVGRTSVSSAQVPRLLYRGTRPPPFGSLTWGLSAGLGPSPPRCLTPGPTNDDQGMSMAEVQAPLLGRTRLVVHDLLAPDAAVRVVGRDRGGVTFELSHGGVVGRG